MKLSFLLLLLCVSCESMKSHNSTSEGTMKEDVIKVMKSKEGMQIIHQNFSAGCFNKTWEFIEKSQLSKEDIENMIATSYASLWHWKKRTDCTDENLSIAYWQLGRVHCLAGKAETAKEFGQKCLKISENLGPFYKGYAYEVLINAAVVSKDMETAKKYLKLAQEQLEKVTDKQDKDYLQKDLEKLLSRINL